MNLETILLIARAAFSIYVVWANYMQDTLPLIVRRKSLAKLKARFNALELDCDGTTKALESTRHALRRCEEELHYSDKNMKLTREKLQDLLLDSKAAKCKNERRIVGDYPVAYWGYREVFSRMDNDDWHLRNPDALDVDPNACEDADPFEVPTSYIMRFDLGRYLPMGCLDNHSTVRMASGRYITFHDGKVIMGDDIHLMDKPYSGDMQDKIPAPALVWSENHQQWFERVSRYEHHPKTPYSLIVS